ncbi:hypothetical protein PRZ48_010644 [Zasmidium cellare]|uniref:Peptidase M43 pregnancy-associated plasma-A domain-containing protein n=1 Tax=Zasmidium cellare TaxID=395010 RepID=A0ABR0E975_ZASCE|nr:hypothetical protein PRZ48_010644 [Zasmidium cellare]
MKLFLTLAAVAASIVSAEYAQCGTPSPSKEHRAILNAAARAASDARKAIFSNQTLRVVDTYVHVVTTSNKTGQYSQDLVNAQIRVLNEKYVPLNAQFNLAATTFTANTSWATAAMGSREEYEMKAALRQGSYGTLNLYFVSDLPGGYLGFCDMAVSDPNADGVVLSGCMILADTMPGGGYPYYNMGYVAVHEVGHWFGLMHVFEGDRDHPCSGPGDEIDDTPIQLRPTVGGCSATTLQDSCPNQPGYDSTDNFMSYNIDECMSRFTPDQIKRATSLFDSFRAGK